MWTVLDPSLVLPEYAVEIQYDWGDSAGSSAMTSSAPPQSSRSRDKDGLSASSMSAELANLAAVGLSGR
jgi:hypothetical protein